ncbi:MAG: hypothetical protein ACREUN_07145 [Burkholderiales bacterium]
MGFWTSLLKKRTTSITDRAGLRRFLETRANLVAQATLYGYLRTRAGMRYPQLFSDDTFVRSINIAKWQLWLACLADLAVYSGGLVASRSGARPEVMAELMRGVVEEILCATGTPADAGAEFPAGSQQVRARLALCDWARVPDDETAFSESPAALVRHAPVIDELKALDEPIVRNSVRFRWQEVRRELRRDLDAAAVIAIPEP